MLLRLLGASNGSADPEETLSVDPRRKSGADEDVIIGGATTQRRCEAGALERTPSEGGDEIKLGGDVVRVSDLRPDSLDGFGVGAGVGSSPLAVVESFSGLSERGRRLRPAGRLRAREGVGDIGTAGGKVAGEAEGDEGT